MKRFVLLAIILMLVAACGSQESVLERSGPRLVSEVTLAPASTLLSASDVPSEVVTPTSSPPPMIQPTAMAPSTTPPPRPIITLDGGVVLVTPTLPPSKTPSQTPTQTLTFTPTRTPSVTPSITATLLVAQAIPGQTTAVSINPASVNCPYLWFFSNPVPNVCALSSATLSRGSLLYFERGFMIWVEAQDAIYVFFNDAASPRWQVFNDAFDATMPETDPAFDVNIPPLSWQPRRGFGLIWRQQASIRERLGWAIQEGETAYNVAIQASADGVIYMGLPNGGVISLSPTGNLWQSY